MLVHKFSAVIWGRSVGWLQAVGTHREDTARAARIILGVGGLHHKLSLLFELNTLPLKWTGMKRCIEFWVKVMRMGEDRLLKQVMMKVRDLEDGVRWRQDLERILRIQYRARKTHLPRFAETLAKTLKNSNSDV